MAKFLTTRFGLQRWTEPGDTQSRPEFDDAHRLIEEQAAGALVWDSTGEPDAIPRPAASADYDRFLSWDRATGRADVCVDTTGAGGWSWVEVLTRDRGNAAYEPLTDRPLVSTAVRVYYLDQTNGNDANDGLSAATAFKTWDAARRRIPRFIHHNTTIRVIGSTTDVIALDGAIVARGAALEIRGDTTVAANHEVPEAVFTAISGEFGFQYFRSLGVVRGRAMDVLGVMFRNLEPRNPSGAALAFEACGSVGAVYCAFGTGVVQDCIYADQSRVYSVANSGQGTGYGLLATGASTIGKYSTQPTGATANEFAQRGGVIR